MSATRSLSMRMQVAHSGAQRRGMIAPTRLLSLGAVTALVAVACSLSGYSRAEAPQPVAATLSRRRQTAHAAWLGHWERAWVDDAKVEWLLELTGVPMLVRRILMAIRSLLTDPNCASPANPEAAQLYQSDLKGYGKRVRRVAEKSVCG